MSISVYNKCTGSEQTLKGSNLWYINVVGKYCQIAIMSKDLAIIFLAAHVRDKDCTSYQQTPLCSEVQYSIIMWEEKQWRSQASCDGRANFSM